jgi:hypothetical protein
MFSSNPAGIAPLPCGCLAPGQGDERQVISIQQDDNGVVLIENTHSDLRAHYCFFRPIFFNDFPLF